ncbi:MAG TPA: hypothetical protein VF273_11010 [Pelobium sp.]
MIWAFSHAVRFIFLAEKAKKDVTSIVNATAREAMGTKMILQ